MFTCEGQWIGWNLSAGMSHRDRLQSSSVRYRDNDLGYQEVGA